MKSVIKLLSGKKTYLIATIGVLGAVVAFLEGTVDISGMVTAILVALGFASLRSAATKPNTPE